MSRAVDLAVRGGSAEKLMARSTVPTANARQSFAQRFSARASEGAIAGALVFVVCFLAWSLGPPAFEAQGILALPADVTGEHAGSRDAIPGVSVVTTSDFVLGYPTFSDSVYGIFSADGRKLRVRCRASSEQRALAQCTQVLAAVRKARPDVELASPVVAASKPRSPVHWPGIALALGLALLCGVAFMAYSALFRRAPARVSRRPVAPSPLAEPARTARPSSEPPPVLIIRPEGQTLSYAPSARPGRSARPSAGAPPSAALPAPPSRPALVVEVRSIAPGNELVPIRAALAPSSPGDSLPMPEIPEGPLVQALPVRGFTPHPRLVRAPSDERFRALCSRIAWNADDASSIVGVTSATDIGPKVPMVAARLAWFVAQMSKVRVLLLEAEFEAPLLHTVVGLEAPPQGGFSQQLQARLGPARNEPWKVQRCAPMLDVLVESRFRAHRAPHVPQFEHAIEVFRMHYDVVIACLPPIEMLAERSTLTHLADSVVAVVERGGSVQAARTAASVAFGQERVLAVVEETEFGERTTFAPNET